jgi:hypothetical protein
MRADYQKGGARINLKLKTIAVSRYAAVADGMDLTEPSWLQCVHGQ